MKVPIFMAVVGSKGLGKSVSVIEHCRKIVKGDTEHGVRGKNCLILDTNLQYKFHDRYPDFYDLDKAKPKAPHINPNNLPAIYRITPFDRYDKHRGRDFAKIIHWISTELRDIVIVVEDMCQMIQDSEIMPLMDKFCFINTRTRNVDVILITEDISQLTVRMWQNLDYIQLYKCWGNINGNPKYLGKAVCLEIANNLVKERYSAGDRRFHVIIDLNREKIYAKDLQDLDIPKAVAQYGIDHAMEYSQDNAFNPGELIQRHFQ